MAENETVRQTRSRASAEESDVLDVYQAADRLNTGPSEIRRMVNAWENARAAGIRDEDIRVEYLRALPRKTKNGRMTGRIRIPKTEITENIARGLAKV